MFEPGSPEYTIIIILIAFIVIAVLAKVLMNKINGGGSGRGKY